jgi:hypothetical protein
VRERDYAFEALAEVTASDPSVARGQLNAALRDIRAQEPLLAPVTESYLLSAEIHERAKMYRAVWPDVALTSNALAKHWLRLPEEHSKLKRGGTNLNAGDCAPPYRPASRDRNLAEVRKLRQAMGWDL